jgi:hypothetical protein
VALVVLAGEQPECERRVRDHLTRHGERTMDEKGVKAPV